MAKPEWTPPTFWCEGCQNEFTSTADNQIEALGAHYAIIHPDLPNPYWETRNV